MSCPRCAYLERLLRELCAEVIDENQHTCEPEGASCELASRAESVMKDLSRTLEGLE